MRSIKIYIIIALLITFFAGLSTGRLNYFRKGEPPQARRGPMGRIFDELQLSPDQREKIGAAFKKAMSEAPPPSFDKFRECDRKRDAAIEAMLTPEQRDTMAKINSDYDREIDDLNAPGATAFKKAAAEARALMTPAQQEKFDKLMAEKMPWPRNPRPRGHDGPERNRNGQPPATQPQ